MISHINGTIIDIRGPLVTIALPGGIAFDVYTPRSESLILNAQTQLCTYMHWSQENGPTLYGFKTAADRILFTLIITCPGIGPKMALSALYQMDSAELASALYENDIKKLSSISGIGKKKAEQLALQLHSKIAKLLETGALAAVSDNVEQLRGISDTLASLNYSRSEIAGALQYLQHNQGDSRPTFDQALRQVLAFLSKRA